MKDKLDIKLKIIDELEEKRNRAFSEKEERKKKIFSEFPELFEITKKINLLGLENTKNIMRDPENAKKYNKEFESKIKKLENQRIEFLKENNIDPEFDKIKYSCKNCSDTGYL